MENTIRGYEDQLQQECILWWHNVFSLRNPFLIRRLHCNNNNSVNRIAGNRAKAMGVMAGVSDLELMLPLGKVLFIELKRPGGVQSKEQKEFAKLCDALMHEYVIIYSFEEFKRLVTSRLGMGIWTTINNTGK